MSARCEQCGKFARFASHTIASHPGSFDPLWVCCECARPHGRCDHEAPVADRGDLVPEEVTS